eukprot:gene6279-7000_t
MEQPLGCLSVVNNSNNTASKDVGIPAMNKDITEPQNEVVMEEEAMEIAASLFFDFDDDKEEETVEQKKDNEENVEQRKEKLTQCDNGSDIDAQEPPAKRSKLDNIKTNSRLAEINPAVHLLNKFKLMPEKRISVQQDTVTKKSDNTNKAPLPRSLVQNKEKPPEIRLKPPFMLPKITLQQNEKIIPETQVNADVRVSHLIKKPRKKVTKKYSKQEAKAAIKSVKNIYRQKALNLQHSWQKNLSTNFDKTVNISDTSFLLNQKRKQPTVKINTTSQATTTPKTFGGTIDIDHRERGQAYKVSVKIICEKGKETTNYTPNGVKKQVDKAAQIITIRRKIELGSANNDANAAEKSSLSKKITTTVIGKEEIGRNHLTISKRNIQRLKDLIKNQGVPVVKSADVSLAQIATAPKVEPEKSTATTEQKTTKINTSPGCIVSTSSGTISRESNIKIIEGNIQRLKDLIKKHVTTVSKSTGVSETQKTTIQTGTFAKDLSLMQQNTKDIKLLKNSDLRSIDGTSKGSDNKLISLSDMTNRAGSEKADKTTFLTIQGSKITTKNNSPEQYQNSIPSISATSKGTGTCLLAPFTPPITVPVLDTSVKVGIEAMGLPKIASVCSLAGSKNTQPGSTEIELCLSGIAEQQNVKDTITLDLKKVARNQDSLTNYSTSNKATTFTTVTSNATASAAKPTINIGNMDQQNQVITPACTVNSANGRTPFIPFESSVKNSVSVAEGLRVPEIIALTNTITKSLSNLKNNLMQEQHIDISRTNVSATVTGGMDSTTVSKDPFRPINVGSTKIENIKLDANRQPTKQTVTKIKPHGNNAPTTAGQSVSQVDDRTHTLRPYSVSQKPPTLPQYVTTQANSCAGQLQAPQPKRFLATKKLRQLLSQNAGAQRMVLIKNNGQFGLLPVGDANIPGSFLAKPISLNNAVVPGIESLPGSTLLLPPNHFVPSTVASSNTLQSVNATGEFSDMPHLAPIHLATGHPGAVASTESLKHNKSISKTFSAEAKLPHNSQSNVESALRNLTDFISKTCPGIPVSQAQTNTSNQRPVKFHNFVPKTSTNTFQPQHRSLISEQQSSEQPLLHESKVKKPPNGPGLYETTPFWRQGSSNLKNALPENFRIDLSRSVDSNYGKVFKELSDQTGKNFKMKLNGEEFRVQLGLFENQIRLKNTDKKRQWTFLPKHSDEAFLEMIGLEAVVDALKYTFPLPDDVALLYSQMTENDSTRQNRDILKLIAATIPKNTKPTTVGIQTLKSNVADKIFFNKNTLASNAKAHKLSQLPTSIKDLAMNFRSKRSAFNDEEREFSEQTRGKSREQKTGVNTQSKHGLKRRYPEDRAEKQAHKTTRYKKFVITKCENGITYRIGIKRININIQRPFVKNPVIDGTTSKNISGVVKPKMQEPFVYLTDILLE